MAFPSLAPPKSRLVPDKNKTLWSNTVVKFISVNCFLHFLGTDVVKQWGEISACLLLTKGNINKNWKRTTRSWKRTSDQWLRGRSQSCINLLWKLTVFQGIRIALSPTCPISIAKYNIGWGEAIWFTPDDQPQLSWPMVIFLFILGAYSSFRKYENLPPQNS